MSSKELSELTDEELSERSEYLANEFQRAEDAVRSAQSIFASTRELLSRVRCEEKLRKLAQRGIVPGTKVTDGTREYGFMGVEPQDMFMGMAGAELILMQVKKNGAIGRKRVRPPMGLRLDDLHPVEIETRDLGI